MKALPGHPGKVLAKLGTSNPPSPSGKIRAVLEVRKYPQIRFISLRNRAFLPITERVPNSLKKSSRLPLSSGILPPEQRREDKNDQFSAFNKVEPEIYPDQSFISSKKAATLPMLRNWLNYCQIVMCSKIACPCKIGSNSNSDCHSGLFGHRSFNYGGNDTAKGEMPCLLQFD